MEINRFRLTITPKGRKNWGSHLEITIKKYLSMNFLIQGATPSLPT